MESQEQQILNYMKQGNRITPAAAYHKFGCLALHSRISDLRQKGFNVDDERVKGKRYKEYYFKKHDWGQK